MNLPTGTAVYTNGQDLFLERDGYEAFLDGKVRRAAPLGFELGQAHPSLFPFQREIVKWATKRGRAAIFADTGLGKTRMQLQWGASVCAQTNGSVLILAPLAVAQQTVEEGAAMGATVTLCRDDNDMRRGLNVTNYDRLHKFDPERFAGVVLDESSILKSLDGKTRTALIDSFRGTPYRLCCTATPAPNDVMELGNHSEFLGVLPHIEMLATYFTHDGGETQKWRLKGHAERAFWQWVASWAVVVQKPSDLGAFEDGGYDLPALEMIEHVLDGDDADDGMLFAMPAQGLMQTRAARRDGIDKRAQWVAEIVRSRSGRGEGPWLIWCDLNAEADAIAALIPDAIEVRGSDDRDDKEQRLIDFAHGKIRVLITKPSIAGFGMNWQVCSNMVFAGVSHSWESLYQAIRRCWRFGQTKPVAVHLVLTEREKGVLENLKRKERDAERMRTAMVAEAMLGFREAHRSHDYTHPKVEVPSWLIAS